MKYFLHRFFFPIFFLLCCLGSISFSQQTDSLSTLQRFAPNIFIDCDYCDEDFIRKEISFANYVRDPNQAMIHLLVTTQETGSGGRENTVTFIGKNKFDGKNDTLQFITQQSATQEEKRSALVRVLKIGLAPYIMKTPLADKLTVSYSGESKQETIVDDWDYWVFNLNVNGNLDGESSSNDMWLGGNVSANRITENWKILFSTNANFSRSHSSYGTIDETTIRRGQSFSGFIVKSIDENWSAGFLSEASSSSYSNNKRKVSLAPAVEYNLFPYTESTRRQLRFLYFVNVTHFRYNEITLYDKTKETRVQQTFTVSLVMKQPWGSTETSVEASNYFHDFNKRKIEINGSISIRIIEGLSFRINGRYAKINDQLSLRKGKVSAEDVLLRRKQLATSYSYYSYFGLSYSFGSIYNNIVNPRFGN